MCAAPIHCHNRMHLSGLFVFVLLLQGLLSGTALAESSLWQTLFAPGDETGQTVFEPDPDLDELGQVQHWIHLGELRAASADLEGALAAYTEALNLAQSLPAPESEADLYLRMGILHGRQGRWADAVDLLDTAKQRFARLDDFSGQTRAEIEKGKLLRNFGELEDSQEAFIRIVEELRERGDQYLLAVVLNEYGELLFEVGNLVHAMPAFNEVIEIAGLEDVARERIRAYFNRARVYQERGDHSLALLSAQAVIDLAEEEGEDSVVRDSYRLMSEAYAAMGSHRMALHAHQNYVTWLERLQSQKNDAQIRGLRSQYISALQARQAEMERKHSVIESATKAQTEWNLQRQSIQRILMIVGLFLLLFVSIVFYFEARFRRRAHREQKRLNKQLSKALAEAEQASASARHADTAKTQFLANMSHEIRTPLNAVIGMASILQDTHLDEEQEGCLSAILTSGNSLLSLLNDLLDFSKIESGKLDLEQASFNLSEVVDEVMDIFRSAAAQKKLELISDIDEGLPGFFIGDPARLRQILLNLVGNALKFTQEGEVLLRVSSQSRILDGEVLHFVVKDTGIGIAEDRLNQLFEPFTQADSSHTRKYGGTGLGLSISRRLCELMKGEMWVESSLGAGSTFHLTLPFKVDALSRENLDAFSELEGRLVLILDDNPNNRKILCSFFQRVGVDSVESDGLHPLPELMRASRPELVLVDCQMSKGGGLDLGRQIREQPNHRQIPIVFLSSVSDADLRKEAFDLGASDYIIKPVKRERLYRSMVKLLGRESYRLEESKGETSEADALDNDTMELTSARPVETSNKAQGEHLRVLLVEDNRINQRVAMILLKKMGHQVFVASNGLEALDWIAEHPKVDVVLMDLQMPKMDGIEATREIRKRLPAADQPVIIAMTAATQVEDEAKCRQAGMDGFLSKPVKPGALMTALNNVLVRGS